jgi:UDPglucose 6-dehydrogenase
VAQALHAAGVAVRGYDPYVGAGEPEKLAGCEVVYVCVPTPGSDDGSLDTTAVWKAIHEIEPHLRDATVVAVKSTVPPGTSDDLAAEFERLELASVPEFLVAARPLETFMNPDRVVIGAREERVFKLLLGICRFTSCDAPLVLVSPIEAELIKLCSNAMLAAKVSLANELALICETSGVDWRRVQEGVGLDHRIGRDHLSVRKDRGFGGGCLPKDLNGLIATADALGYSPRILSEIADFNRRISDSKTAHQEEPAGSRAGRVR